jgi:anti-anti-sigma factor
MISSSEPVQPRLSVEPLPQGSAYQVVVRGEADVANADRLRAALDAIGLDGASTLCLELGELTFLDVAALRELAAFTQRVRRSGRQVVTRGARPILQRTAGVLGVEDMLGLSTASR